MLHSLIFNIQAIKSFSTKPQYNSFSAKSKGHAHMPIKFNGVETFNTSYKNCATSGFNNSFNNIFQRRNLTWSFRLFYFFLFFRFWFFLRFFILFFAVLNSVFIRIFDFFFLRILRSFLVNFLFSFFFFKIFDFLNYFFLNFLVKAFIRFAINNSFFTGVQIF